MAFWDKVSTVAKFVENEMHEQLDEYEKKMKRELRKRSDEEIRRAYEKRYDNPNLTDFNRRILEEEADRRGIS